MQHSSSVGSDKVVTVSFNMSTGVLHFRKKVAWTAWQEESEQRMLDAKTFTVTLYAAVFLLNHSTSANTCLCVKASSSTQPDKLSQNCVSPYHLRCRSGIPASFRFHRDSLCMSVHGIFLAFHSQQSPWSRVYNVIWQSLHCLYLFSHNYVILFSCLKQASTKIIKLIKKHIEIQSSLKSFTQNLRTTLEKKTEREI